jgi:multidrug resistance efflux pump
MSTVFFRSSHVLSADTSYRWAVGLLLVATLLCAWGGWFCLARVRVYRVTETAHLETHHATYPVEAPVAGRVVATQAVLGQEVQAGDVLVELDAEAQLRQLAEEQTRLAAFAPQLATLRDAVTAEQQALSEARQTGRVTLDEARVQSRGAEEALSYAEEKAGRLLQLHARGYVAELDLLRAQAETQQHRVEVDTRRLEINRLERDHRTQQSDRTAHIEQLKHEASRLAGEIDTATATVKRLEYEIEQRRIRAPVAGRLGEVANIRVGTFIAEGGRVGTVVPPGVIRAVADFPPSAALGRIEPGQPARLRLTGFPWTQYGSVAATVASVASEARDGQIRVELLVDPNPLSPIPLRHGLPGIVEVEVEQVSPATLVLRAAGQFLTRPATSSGS